MSVAVLFGDLSGVSGGLVFLIGESPLAVTGKLLAAGASFLPFFELPPITSRSLRSIDSAGVRFTGFFGVEGVLVVPAMPVSDC